MGDIIEQCYHGMKSNGKSDVDFLYLMCNSHLIDYEKIVRGIQHKNKTLQMIINGCNHSFGDVFLTGNKEKNPWTSSSLFQSQLKEKFTEISTSESLNGKNMIIMELGTHYGYTTGILSDIFKKIYAVDISPYFIGINTVINSSRKNIMYIQADIYNEGFWGFMKKMECPNVVFVDAIHSYECVTEDIHHILQLPSAEYIIFDDYGSWNNVNRAVNDSIGRDELDIECYFGLKSQELNAIQLPFGIQSDIIQDCRESVMCKIKR